MIGVLEKLECRARTELPDERLQERQIRQLITRSLHEQHRSLHFEQVLSALVRRPPRRMKRESEEHQAANSRQRRCGLRLRSHAATKRFAAGHEGKAREQARCFCDGRADGSLGKLGSVRPLRAPLHIGKLIAKRGDAVLGKSIRDVRHERVRHARACAVRHDIAGACIAWRKQQTGDALRVVDSYRHGLRRLGSAHFSAMAFRLARGELFNSSPLPWRECAPPAPSARE